MQTSEHQKWKSLQLKAGGHFSLLIKLNGLDSHQGKRQPYISDGNRVEYPLKVWEGGLKKLHQP